MAIEASQLQNTRIRPPIEADIPLDSHTVESLGLPKQIDRRDLLAFLSNQSARLSTIVEPPLFRSLEGDLGEPTEGIIGLAESVSEQERAALTRWIAELAGLKPEDGDVGAALATLDDAEGSIDRIAGAFDQFRRAHADRLSDEADAAERAADEEDDAATDPSRVLPEAPDDDFDWFFKDTVFQSELNALQDFDQDGSWKKFMREVARKGDVMALLVAVAAYIEQKAGVALKALGEDQLRLNDRLAMAADKALQVGKVAGENSRMASALTTKLNTTVGSLQNESQMNMMRIREHLTSISQIEQTMSAIKNIYSQTQVQGVIRKITN